MLLAHLRSIGACSKALVQFVHLRLQPRLELGFHRHPLQRVHQCAVVLERRGGLGRQRRGARAHAQQPPRGARLYNARQLLLARWRACVALRPLRWCGWRRVPEQFAASTCRVHVFAGAVSRRALYST